MKNKILIIICGSVLTLLAACSFFADGNPGVHEYPLTFLGGASRSTVGTDGNVDHVWVRVFAQDGTHIPDLDSGDYATLTDTGDTWTGTIRIDTSEIVGDLVFHAMAFNADGKILYQGTDADVTQGSTTPPTFPADIAYSVGNRGPSGGWVIYDRGSYTADANNDMGKIWRYLEIAPFDMSMNWVDDVLKLDDTMVDVLDGDVYEKNTVNLLLSKYDWYFGPAGTFTTLEDVAEGNRNTEILQGDITGTGIDAVSNATPSVLKTRGRKTQDTASVRRDTSQSLSNAEPSFYTDWFFPSCEDLERAILAASGNPAAWNLNADRYWSSSEDSDGGNNPAAYTDPVTGDSVTYTTLTDEYWGWTVKTSDGTGEKRHRSEAYHVRPARAF